MPKGIMGDVILPTKPSDPECRVIAPRAPKHAKMVRSRRGRVSVDGLWITELTYFYSAFEKHFKIGQGSFGVVFKASCRDVGEESAVKVLTISRLRNWKNTLSKVLLHSEVSSHPNIVTLYNTWLEDDLLYMQMELCTQDLFRFIMTDQNVDESHMWDVLTDILQALEYLHSLNMVHLDVKPENILIGFDQRYKLSDFDLMFHYPIAEPESIICPGDDRYRAPETTDRDFNPKNDIFSLGMTLLEMAGDFRLPNGGETWAALRNNCFPLAQLKQRKISDGIIYVIKKMLKKDMYERPSAIELLHYTSIKEHVIHREGDIQGTTGVVEKLLAHNAEKLQKNISLMKSAWEAKTPLSEQMLKAASYPYHSDKNDDSPPRKLRVSRKLLFEED